MRLPINHFDLLARNYDRLIGRPVNDPLPRLVNARDGMYVLDIGGGTGRNALALRDGGAWVVVCDLSLGMLHQARERGLPAVRADVNRLPFAARAFDRAVAVDAFHHFVDPSPEVAQTQAVVELLRVLAPEGRLILEEPDIRQWQTRFIAAAERVLLMRSRFLSPQTLVNRVEDQGGRCVQWEQHGFSVGLVFQLQRTDYL